MYVFLVYLFLLDVKSLPINLEVGFHPYLFCTRWVRYQLSITVWTVMLGEKSQNAYNDLYFSSFAEYKLWVLTDFEIVADWVGRARNIAITEQALTHSDALFNTL